MPNKYKVELTIVDNYEEAKEDPMDYDDVKEAVKDLDIGDLLSDNYLTVEGEIKVTKIEGD